MIICLVSVDVVDVGAVCCFSGDPSESNDAVVELFARELEVTF